ncbi:Sec20-domain-containing protein [Lyophyllum atratum]|nr:Sec20-domain-containing protein [Lyophyllum atratum]
MPPVPSTFSEDTSSQISAAKRRQTDLVEFQIPRLRSCKGPLSLQQKLAAELREDIDFFSRQVEALDISVGDQRGEKSRTELRRIVNELQEGLAQLRRDSRAALLTSKRAIDSQSKSQREELLASSAVTEKQNVNEKVTDDVLMRANDNVTEALRRTIGLMQGELERSVLSTQMLDASTASLRATSSTHDTLTNVMGTSKQLITALEKSDWIDRILIISAFMFFILVVLFIVKQRILDRSLRIALWWTRFVPDFSGDSALLSMEKGSAVLSPASALLSAAAITPAPSR